jgi:hypothetical protein
METDSIDGQQTNGQQDLLAKFGNRKNDAQLFKHASGPSWIRAVAILFRHAAGCFV